MFLHLFIYLCLRIFHFFSSLHTLFFLYLSRLFLHFHFLVLLHLPYFTHLLLLALSLLAIFVEVQYRI